MPRDKSAKRSLGAAHRLVKESRVLLVGAGGIGCELLKNLVLTGFGEIHIIDLDTIDLSNLNRQFLFRQEHIQKPKALVAKEVAQKFNPDVKLVAHHANIKDKQFNLDWFSGFNLVFNALDNMDARRHVNKMCLAVDVPLIESGTTGFKGQVQVIKKGETACYDCTPKSVPVSYPVCTIRSTPSQAIHCIVWGKSYLLPELFGMTEDETPEVDNTEDSDNAAEIEKLKQEAQALKKIRESMGSGNFAKRVFDKVFKDDIERLTQMEDMWKNKMPPEPLSYDILAKQSSSLENSIIQDTQRVWSTVENFYVFMDSLSRLSKRLMDEQAAASASNLPAPMITFDKDDDDTMDFVAAAGNLRATIFGIEAKSKFDIKQMAGNIIPAIATTNAMIAGLCVTQAFKVLKGEYARTRWLWLWNGALSTERLEPPSSECAVCSVAMARIHVDLEKATLRDLVQDVLKQALGYGEEIAVLNDEGVVYDPDLEDNLEKKLPELGIGDGTFVVVKDEDEGEDVRVDLQLAVVPKTAEGDAKPVVLVEKEGETIEIRRRPKKKPPPVADDQDDEDDEDDLMVVNGADVSTNSATERLTAKRKRDLEEDGGENATSAKKLHGSLVAEGPSTNGIHAIEVGQDNGALRIADD